MNPEDNNTNAGGDSFGMGPIDFTSNSDGLSMSDSLASAQDNLTSAGMAAGDSGSDAMSLDQIGAADSSAFMARPDEPLIPAAPVPGSIGSVISGPALSSIDAPFTNPAAAAAPVSADSMPAGGGDFSSVGKTMPSNVASSPVSISNSMPQLQAVPSQPQQLASNQSAASQGPYNPFGSNVVAPVSSAPNAPGIPFVAPQPPEIALDNVSQPENMPMVGIAKNERKAKGNSNVLTVILGVLAVIMLGLAITFAVLWQMALNESKNPVYVAPPVADDNPQDVKNIAVTCTRETTDAIDGLDGLTSLRSTISLNFTNDVLQNVSVLDSYSFVDGGTADSARGYFDGVGFSYADYATQSGVQGLGINYSVTGNVVDWTATATPEQLVGDNIRAFAMPVDESGTILTNREAVLAGYVANGYTCNEFDN